MSTLTNVDHDGEAWVGDDFDGDPDYDESWQETFNDEERRAELMDAWIDYGAGDDYAACCGFGDE